MTIEKATPNGRGFGDFPKRWGIPPTTDRKAPEFAEWVRSSVVRYEMTGPRVGMKLEELQVQRRQLLARMRLAELDAKRECP